jgi:hypothetical protein
MTVVVNIDDECKPIFQNIIDRLRTTASGHAHKGLAGDVSKPPGNRSQEIVRRILPTPQDFEKARCGAIDCLDRLVGADGKPAKGFDTKEEASAAVIKLAEACGTRFKVTGSDPIAYLVYRTVKTAGLGGVGHDNERSAFLNELPSAIRIMVDNAKQQGILEAVHRKGTIIR